MRSRAVVIQIADVDDEKPRVVPIARAGEMTPTRHRGEPLNEGSPVIAAVLRGVPATAGKPREASTYRICRTGRTRRITQAIGVGEIG